jgi:hypothetical protein
VAVRALSAICEYGLSVARFNVVEVSAANRLDKFAINEVANLERLGAHGGEK